MKKSKSSAGRGPGRAGEASAAPDASRAPMQIEELERLAHELNNLLDGSIRNVGMARRAIEGGGAGEVEDIKRRLDTATFALERMADLVHASMQGGAQPLGSPLLNQAEPITIGEAATHAVEVARPQAQEQRVALAVEIDGAVSGVPAGPLYPVLLNGVRNAIESIGRAGGIGRVVVQVRPARAPRGESDGRRWVEIDIIDDGEGPPDDSPAAVFEAGFTTKPQGTGLGLAVSRDLVKQAGGRIELRRRPDRSDARRPGAVLRVRYPEASGDLDSVVGG